MKVVAFDPFVGTERYRELGVTKAESSDDVYAEADFLTLHLPKTPETQGFINRENLAKTKDGVRIINCARGGLIDEAALKAGLDSGHIGGAALDVFQNEPLPEDSPLWEMPGVFVSPHMSGDSVGWLDALGGLFAENFGRWIRDEPLLNVVDKRSGYAGPAESSETGGEV